MEKNEIIQKLIFSNNFIYDRKLDKIFIAGQEESIALARNDIRESVNLCIEITSACNFFCKNCFSESGFGKPGIYAPLSQIITTLNYYIPSIIRVCITGGEPLMHPSIGNILTIPQLFPECGFVLNTNGSMHDELDQLILENNWCTGISLHGNKIKHNNYTKSDSFDIVKKRITHLAAKGIVHIYTVFHDDISEDDIKWLYNFRDDVGVELIKFILPRKFGRYELLKNYTIVKKTEERIDSHSVIINNKSNSIFLELCGKIRLSN